MNHDPLRALLAHLFHADPPAWLWNPKDPLAVLAVTAAVVTAAVATMMTA
jgi:hypothetical protein